MRALKVAVIVMGVMIVLGVVGLGFALTRVVFGVPPALTSTTLDEPAGTRIASISALPDRLAVQLSGGGPDRVVVIDLRSGRLIARTTLTRQVPN